MRASEAPPSAESADRPSTRLATRLAFFVAGFGVACWAPIVPYVKGRLSVDDAGLGLLILCLGIGSMVSMLSMGILNARYGARRIILAGSAGMILILPLLPLAEKPAELALLMLAFGASLGSLDVAMNIHAVEVDRAAARPLLSGFHALWSVGGIAGSGFVTMLLSLHLTPFESTLTGAIVMALATAIARPRLLSSHPEPTGPTSVMPRGVVVLLAILAGITFLDEGAVLDWGALILTSRGLVSQAHGGLGYLLFSIAMTAGRLCGDAIIGRVGDRSALRWGGVLAMAGFALTASASLASLALPGFVLIGLGASNIVPVLFRRAGAQTVMPAGLAVAAISTVGYAGILAGPAAVGFVSKWAGLRAAFWMLAGLVGVVTLSARAATRAGAAPERPGKPL